MFGLGRMHARAGWASLIGQKQALASKAHAGVVVQRSHFLKKGPQEPNEALICG